MSNTKSYPLIVFGSNIRKLRLEKKMSQEVLAEKAEVHRTYIGMIERGEKNITLSTILRLADALDVKPSNLIEELDSGK